MFRFSSLSSYKTQTTHFPFLIFPVSKTLSGNKTAFGFIMIPKLLLRMVTVVRSAIKENYSWYHWKFILKYQSSVEYILGIISLKEYNEKLILECKSLSNILGMDTLAHSVILKQTTGSPEHETSKQNLTWFSWCKIHSSDLKSASTMYGIITQKTDTDIFIVMITSINIKFFFIPGGKKW